MHQQVECSQCINIHQGPGSGCVNRVTHLCMKLITVECVWQEVQSQLEIVLKASRDSQGT